MQEQRLRSLAARLGAATGGGGKTTINTDYAIVQPGVAVIPIVGVLTKYPSVWDDFCGFVPTQTLLQALEDAAAEAQTIILDIDSPGGFVNGTAELADAIAALGKSRTVIASTRGLCCSGAYWLASQCNQIIGRPESEIGAIGVYSCLMDLSGFYKQLGVSLTLVASGQFKGLGADGKVSEQLISDTRRIVTGLCVQFISAVAAGRGMSTQKAAEVSDGRAWLGAEALKLGLIDSIATSFDQVVAIATKKSAGAAPDDPGDEDLEQRETQIKAEWQSNRDNCQNVFLTERHYVTYRKRELAGTIGSRR
jgi:signal peptide peptidase SppA